MDEELIESWVEYHINQNKELFWAWEEINEIVLNNPDEALEYILTITNRAESPIVLANLGAGPLEDFLVHHGASYIDQVEVKARQIPKFANVVKHVWKNNICEDVWVRIRSIQEKY